MRYEAQLYLNKQIFTDSISLLRCFIRRLNGGSYGPSTRRNHAASLGRLFAVSQEYKNPYFLLSPPDDLDLASPPLVSDFEDDLLESAFLSPFEEASFLLSLAFFSPFL